MFPSFLIPSRFHSTSLQRDKIVVAFELHLKARILCNTTQPTSGDPQPIMAASKEDSTQLPDYYNAPKERRIEAEVQKRASLTEDERPIAPDQVEDKWLTSKWEIWSWYAYYIGNNGLTLFNFAPTAAQNLVYQRAVVVGGENNMYLDFAGGRRTIESIILLCNGISFAIQIVLFLVIGAYADFGTFRPKILIGVSIVAWGIGFGW